MAANLSIMVDCIQEIDSQTNLFNCFREMFVLQENMVITYPNS